VLDVGTSSSQATDFIREAIKEGVHVFYEWLALLHYLARTAERHPGLVIVLDEFPYLVDGDPALPSMTLRTTSSDCC
jgi:hypothetical protein